MTEDEKGKNALSRNARTSRVMRANCNFTQQEVADGLGIDRKKFSAMERGAKGTKISRDLLDREARVMKHSEALVAETYAHTRWTDELRLQGPLGLALGLRNASRRVWSGFARTCDEMAYSWGCEMVEATERAAAELVWKLFLDLPEPSRRPLVDKDPLFHRWAFAERLWRESVNAAADDARRALELGELAVLAAERVPVGDPFKGRLLGLAWSAVANARRVGGQPRAADTDFAKAKGLWKAGESGRPEILDEARFLMLETALRVDQRHFPEAEACIDAAFRAAKPGEDVVYLFIAKGNILFELQRHEDATAIYRKAEARMGPSTTLRERFGTRFNLTACMIALGRAEEAEAELPALRKMAVAIGNGLDSIKVRWLEGQSLAGLGRQGEAIEVLGEVQDVFLAREILFDAALVALERAALQLEGGEIAEVKREAPELAAAFQSLGITRELLTALDLFWGAAQAELATAEQARLLLAQLRRAGGPPAPAA